MPLPLPPQNDVPAAKVLLTLKKFHSTIAQHVNYEL